ncbi:MAG: tripartite tricarboxylate transporter substrate binding protein [Sulfuricaulis sp.]|nr:tripartite tricarboxylate transporter substrate binding protein [Sulfuricaulis sp.]
MISKSCLALFVAANVAVAGAASAAGKYPVKPIRMVVPFPPGAASDFLARAIGQKLNELYGQQIVIDNRPGAGGLVGSTIVATAVPDGYTLTLVGQPHLVNTLIHKNPGYRPFEDFASVTEVASMPNVLVVAPNLQVKSVSDLIALAKAKPGQLNFGSAGIGSSSHLAGEMFKSTAGINVVHIPFRLLGDIFTEMLAGRVHLYVFPLPAVMPMLQQGKLRPLAVATPKRAVAIPEVPTMAESGLPAYQSDSWFGVVAPARTPRAIIGQLNQDIVRILQQPEVKERFLRQGAEPVFGSPEQFLKLQKDEYVRIRKLVKDIGIEPR